MELRNNRRMNVVSKSMGQKSVLVLGAGYVAGPLVDYLTRDKNLRVTVASELHGQGMALVKSSNTNSIVLDVTNQQDMLEKLIDENDLVVSILPYSLHPMVAKKVRRRI